MKKLIAQRPIQYMGRTYQRGDTLPAHETGMVKAWINAGSAAWQGVQQLQPGATTEMSSNDCMAADVLRRMGVVIESDAGEYVGDENIIRQIRAVCNETAQERTDRQELNEPAEPENGAPGQPDSVEMMDAHLDAEQLVTWKNADLERLAADLGVDISKAKNKTERAQMIAAVQVRVPADDPGSGGGVQ